MRSGRSSPGYMRGKPSGQLTIRSSTEPPRAVDNHWLTGFGQRTVEVRVVIEGVGWPGLRLDADGIGRFVVDNHAGTVGFDSQLESARPAQDGRSGQVG